MLESITIREFRGFEEVEVSGLAQYNILMGQNGAGKTSLLDAFSIIANPFSVRSVTEAGYRRDLPWPTEENDVSFRSIFRDLQPHRVPEFKFLLDGTIRELDIIPMRDFVRPGSSEQAVQQPLEADDDRLIVGLTLRYRAGSRQPIVNQAQLRQYADHRPDLLDLVRRERVADALGCFTVEARRATAARATAEVLADLIRRNKLKDFLDLVHCIAPEVVTFHSMAEGGETMIWVATNAETKPLNLMGDGFCRLVLIATGLLGGNRLVLVDEIDSGLHRRVMADFWRQLAQLAAGQPAQLICATHNEEMLKGAIEAFAGCQNALAAFRLSPAAPGRPSVVRYDYALLKDSMEAGFDPRG